MTTNELILFIDNDRQELGAALDLVRFYDNPNVDTIAKAMECRYVNILENVIILRSKNTSFQRSLYDHISQIFDLVDWNDLASHYMTKVNEGVTVPKE